jgi:hypothetical protein
MSRFARPALSAVLLVLTVLGLVNVYGDHSEVLALAKQVACQGCDARLVELGKTPFSHTYHLQTQGARIEVVTCRRAAIVLGAYSCALDSAQP